MRTQNNAPGVKPTLVRYKGLFISRIISPKRALSVHLVSYWCRWPGTEVVMAVLRKSEVRWSDSSDQGKGEAIAGTQ